MNMLHKIFPNISTKILGLSLVVAIIWWFLLASEATLSNYLFTLFEGLIPLWGGLYGLYLGKKWGFLKSAVGRAVTFLSLGLISWATGTMIFVGYYNLIANVEIPYPSVADAAYIISWPLWSIGMINLSRATGAQYALRNKLGKLVLIVIPIIAIFLSYYLLIAVARAGSIDFSDSGLLKIFFDLAYPIGDIIILTLAVLIYGLSLKYFGGRYRFGIYILLLGFVLNYFADFTFSYTTTVETFYPGGAADLLFTLAMIALSYGVNSLDGRATRMETSL